MAPQDWATRVAAAEPAAREAYPAGTTYEPHDGTTSDFNLHYADMFVGPDVAADPTRVRMTREQIEKDREDLA